MARTPPARTAGQRPLLATVAAVVLAIGGFAVAGAEEAGEGAPGTSGQPAAAPSPEPGRTAEDVGPPRGADVAAYVEDRTAELMDAPAEVDTAVVSFTESLRVQDALALVGTGVEVRGVLLRLPLEGNRPETLRVGTDEDPAAVVGEFLDDAVQPLRDDLAAQQEFLDSGTIDDEGFEADAEQRIEEIQQVLEELEGDAAVVHGLVVRGELQSLQQLSGATAIRLVDPAPPATDIGLSTFRGLLPGDTDTVTFGPIG